AEQVELAGREVEQRADGRVGLAVVVAEVSLEVAFDFGDAPVGKQLPALREALVKLYFDRPVLADRAGEPVSHAIRAGIACGLAVRAKRLEADAQITIDEVAAGWVGRIRPAWSRHIVYSPVRPYADEGGSEFDPDRIHGGVELRGNVADE